MQDLQSNIIKAFEEIANDILLLWKEVMDSDVGINPKVGYNTLSHSILREDVEEEIKFPSILFKYNDYADYIETGRRPHVTKVPIYALKEWASRKGIYTDNNTLYAIREAIYRDGISPRPIFTMFSELLDKGWNERYAQNIFDKITESLSKYFKK